ncbi:MAG TPA: glycosyltransferase family 39 protein, partial [Bacteroidia bacterium]
MLYPFLNVWDERFHALVAKNLMHHPLMPTLYDDPIVNMAYSDSWATYHIWLHKQPLFMWQIALSFKIFGVNEFALRLPSVLLGCLIVFAGYRSGKILGNKNTGYYTALLLATSPYIMQLISGRVGLDQNDVSFIEYISLSLWAWLEYIKTKEIKWLVLIGIFSGFAILCKWLVGLLVYLSWGLYSVMENKLQIKKYKDILLAVGITVIVFLPWQIFTFYQYPNEAKAALDLNAKHFTMAVDGQGGSFLYHFNLISKLYGSLVLYLIIPAFIIFYLKTSYRKIALAMISSILFVYLFFSFAATKMPSFTSVVILPMCLALAFLIDFLINSFEKLKLPLHINRTFLLVTLVLLVFFRVDITLLLKYHTFSMPLKVDDDNYRPALSHNKKVFQSLHLPANTVIFNVTARTYIDAMFYTGLPTYNFIPSEEQYRDMKQKKRLIAIFKPQDG